MVAAKRFFLEKAEGDEQVTDKKKKSRQEREEEIALLAHSIAGQAVSIEGTTYSDAFRILKRAEIILTNNMERQQAAVPLEIRDSWGTIIGMSGTEVPGKK